MNITTNSFDLHVKNVFKVQSYFSPNLFSFLMALNIKISLRQSILATRHCVHVKLICRLSDP